MAATVKFPHIEVKLLGEDGNVFNLIGLVRQALKKEGLHRDASQFAAEAMSQKSYGDVLNLIQTWVTVV